MAGVKKAARLRRKEANKRELKGDGALGSHRTGEARLPWQLWVYRARLILRNRHTIVTATKFRQPGIVVGQ